jgi:hypothetical protein
MAAADHGGRAPDLYGLLGVGQGASAQELALAWRRRARASARARNRPGAPASDGRASGGRPRPAAPAAGRAVEQITLAVAAERISLELGLFW